MLLFCIESWRSNIYLRKYDNNNGNKKKELKVIGDVGARNTGTTITFKPNDKYFESDQIKIKELKRPIIN